MSEEQKELDICPFCREPVLYPDLTNPGTVVRLIADNCKIRRPHVKCLKGNEDKITDWH